MLLIDVKYMALFRKEESAIKSTQAYSNSLARFKETNRGHEKVVCNLHALSKATVLK